MPKPQAALALEQLEDRVVLTAGSWGYQILPHIEQENLVAHVQDQDTQDEKDTSWIQLFSFSQSISRPDGEGPADDITIEQQQHVQGGLVVPTVQSASAKVH